MDPWRYSTSGISVALRVTPRGGRDDIDGIDTLANVMELLAKALGVPKAKVKILSGTTSRLKQVAVDGDPKLLGEALRKMTAAKMETKD
jgi:uncharacterized protein YggU (UPF0235/DUF167 family)